MNEITAMYENMGISPAVYAYGEATIARLKERFEMLEGLEFDGVIVVDENGSFTGAGNERFLYLASTRALHKLNVFSVEK